MKEIFSEIVECLQRKERIILATIVSSSGSSPLPSGAMMLVKSGGEEVIGSVGGGLLEALVIEEAKKHFARNELATVGKFDLNDDVSNEGMICGGSVDVLLEPISQDDLTVFQKLAQARNEGNDCILIRELSEPQRISRSILISQRVGLPESVPSDVEGGLASLNDVVRRTFGQEDVKRMKATKGEVIIQPVRGVQDLVIFGGGHVSKYLAQIATVAGFSTTVIDDREEFADPGRFPGARVLALEYEQAFRRIEVRPSTYIVIVTRGHSFDELVLQHALQTPAKYIGMIGSRRKVIACFEDLARRGVRLQDLQRVHAPIGLDIGAVSAEEIAVSIVAELVKVRRGFSGASVAISDQLGDWFAKHT